VSVEAFLDAQVANVDTAAEAALFPALNLQVQVARIAAFGERLDQPVRYPPTRPGGRREFPQLRVQRFVIHRPVQRLMHARVQQFEDQRQLLLARLFPRAV
jgi:hypothetical protein